MMGAAKGHHDGIVALSQTDCTEDATKIADPVLHSETVCDLGRNRCTP
jgi:hypothetical protein